MNRDKLIIEALHKATKPAENLISPALWGEMDAPMMARLALVLLDQAGLSLESQLTVLTEVEKSVNFDPSSEDLPSDHVTYAHVRQRSAS